MLNILKEEQNTELDSNGNDQQHGNENNGMYDCFRRIQIVLFLN
jgi:hypothetical protein